MAHPRKNSVDFAHILSYEETTHQHLLKFLPLNLKLKFLPLSLGPSDGYLFKFGLLSNTWVLSISYFF